MIHKCRYAVPPAEVLFDPGLSWKMKGRYSILLGEAFNNPQITLTLEGIAALWSEAEGGTITAHGVSVYLSKMAEKGLIERQQKNAYDWIIRLLKRVIKGAASQPATAQPQPATAQPQPATAQPQPATAQPQPSHSPATDSGEGITSRDEGVTSRDEGVTSRDLITNYVVDDVNSRLDHQQQHIFRYLSLREVLPKAALDFALKRVSLWEAVGWGEYAWARRRQLNNYAGLIVARLGVGDPAPEVTLNRCPMCGLRECCNECGFYAALDADEG